MGQRKLPPIEEPPELELNPIRKRGKPRRGADIADVTTVRIDAVTKEILKANFGTVGNALYFIAQGLGQYRDLNEARVQALSEALDPHRPEATQPDDLLPREMQALQKLVYATLDKLRDRDPHTTPLYRAMRKIERRAKVQK